jgi:hypothetical protein
MTIAIKPKNKTTDTLEMPNGFWPAFCVETPVNKILGCTYTDQTKSHIRYDHDGYVGAWINKQLTQKILTQLELFVETNNFKEHRYFGSRQKQLIMMIEFLKSCDGFKMIY